MDTLSDATVCLICFQITERYIFVPEDVSAKIVQSCNTYLHSTLSKETLKDIKLQNGNQLPFCKNCFDSALELTQLSEQLATFQKDISDLTITFSLAVFHRRSQAFNSQLQNCSQTSNKSSIIEFNASCLPPHLFSTKNEDQNSHPSGEKNNYNRVSQNNCDENDIDITNVKLEDSDYQSSNCLQPVEKENTEVLLAEGRLEETNRNQQQHQIKTQPHLKPPNGEETVQITCRNDCSEDNNGAQLSMSDLIKSVKMPEIKLERIQIAKEGQKFIVSDIDSFGNESEPSVEFIGPVNENNNESNVTDLPDNSQIVVDQTRLNLCEKTFASEAGRDFHHKSHSGERRFKCSFCKKGHNTLAAMKIHERTHTGEKPFKCSFCEKRCAVFSAIQLHERTHTGEKPFKCSFCKKTFAARSNQTIHERTHTGEKPFKCSFCEKRFAVLYSWQTHKRTHTGEKPFKCLYCDKTFGQIGGRNKHQVRHRNKRLSLFCSFCSQKCGSLSHLKHHEKTHATVEVGIKCSFCELTFSQVEDRLVHEQTHNSENEPTIEDVIVGI